MGRRRLLNSLPSSRREMPHGSRPEAVRVALAADLEVLEAGRVEALAAEAGRAAVAVVVLAAVVAVAVVAAVVEAVAVVAAADAEAAPKQAGSTT